MARRRRAATRPPAYGAGAALRVPAFRVLLAVQLTNAVAVWMHVVAVQWTVTERGEPATVVALAPAAISTPFLLLALPMGVVVGYADRERLLVLATLVSAGAASGAAVLSTLGIDAAAGYLLTVFVVGIALVVVGVAWQSLLPELVDRSLVSSATVADGAVYNVARALGPLLAGAALGLWAAGVGFSLVALLFVACGATVSLYRRRHGGHGRDDHERSGGERRAVLPEIRDALWFTRHSPWTRQLLGRMVMFGLPASALWALVSLVAHDRLGLGSGGFGMVMALMGLGAVAATAALAPLRARTSVQVFAGTGSAAYALTLVAMGTLTSPWLVGAVLVLGGVAWVGVQSTWMMLAHQALPDWVRPRIIALILFAFQGTQAIGSLVWGVVADLIGLSSALLVASALMAASVAVLALYGLSSSDGIEPLLARLDPDRALEPTGRVGGVQVSYTYEVAVTGHDAFSAAMADLRLSRLRLGATGWELGREESNPGRYIEKYHVRGESDLLAQETDRLTQPELRLRAAAADASLRVEGPHVLPAPARSPSRRRRWRALRGQRSVERAEIVGTAGNGSEARGNTESTEEMR